MSPARSVSPAIDLKRRTHPERPWHDRNTSQSKGRRGLVAIRLALLFLARGVLASDGLDLAGGWRFHTDPHNAGLAARWDGVSFNDAAWTVTDTRGPWEDRGAPGYDGVAWYRQWVDVPPAWSRVALVLPPPLDRADLFVNGTVVARDLARPIPGTRRIVRDCTAAAAGRSRILIALRVTNLRRHQPGGFPAEQESPITLVPAIRPLFAARDAWAASLAADWPSGPWPAWLRGEGASWTAIGDPRGGGLGTVGSRGQLEPPEGDSSVSCWLVDRAAKKLFALESLPATLALEDHVLPMPVVRARAGRFNLMVQAWADRLDEAPDVVVGLGAATVENTSDQTREIDLAVVVSPMSPRGVLSTVGSIAYDRSLGAILVNGRPAVIFGGAPDEVAAGPAGEEGTIARALLRGDTLSSSLAEDPAEHMATMAGLYHLRIQPYDHRTVTYRVFLSGRPDHLDPEMVQQVRDVGHKASWKESKIRWQHLLAGKERPVIRLSDRDKEVQHAFYACTGQLIMAAGAGLDARDRPVAAAALRRAGHAELAAALTGSTGWEEPHEAVGSVSATASHDGGFPADRPADGFEAAARAALGGDGEPAGRVTAWWLAHQTQPGAYAWAATVDPVHGRWGEGRLPDPRAAAAFVRLVRDALLREGDGALWLASAVPEEWIRPGKLVEIRWAPTAWGIFPGYALVASPSRLSLRRLKSAGTTGRGRGPVVKPGELAHPPGGYRWRVAGTRKIRQVLVDGSRLREVPADRVIVLGEDFRQATVTW